MSCEICGATENLQTHHDSYNPPITRILCVGCHFGLHGHGVGLPVGKVNNKFNEFGEAFSKAWDDELTYEDLADKFDISIMTVYKWSILLNKRRRNRVGKRYNREKIEVNVSKYYLKIIDKIVESLYRDRDEYIRDAIDEKLWKDFPTVMRKLVLEFHPKKEDLDA